MKKPADGIRACGGLFIYDSVLARVELSSLAVGLIGRKALLGQQVSRKRG